MYARYPVSYTHLDVYKRQAVLDVPGGSLAVGAGRITRQLNGHPDEGGAASLGERVVVIGHGNVAMDIARLLARDSDGLEGSDIDDRVHNEIAGRVRTIHLVGRSLPASAKFDPVMVRELAGLPGVQHVVHGAGELPDDGRDARIDAVRALVGGSEASDETARVRIEWWFGLTPTEIHGSSEGDAGGERDAVVASDDGRAALEAAAEVPAATVTAVTFCDAGGARVLSLIHI